MIHANLKFIAFVLVVTPNLFAQSKTWNFLVHRGMNVQTYQLINEKNEYKLKTQAKNELISVNRANAKYLLEQIDKWPISGLQNKCPKNFIEVSFDAPKPKRHLACLDGPKNKDLIQIESARRAAEALYFLSFTK